MRKFGLALVYLASALIALGGLGDQFIVEFLDVHHAYLGRPDPGPLLERAEGLLLLMLHVLGGGLMASGVACLAMTHFALRQGHGWALPAIGITALLGEGFNAYGMYRVGSYWVYPVTVLSLLFVGLISFHLSPKQEGPQLGPLAN